MCVCVCVCIYVCMCMYVCVHLSMHVCVGVLEQYLNAVSLYWRVNSISRCVCKTMIFVGCTYSSQTIVTECIILGMHYLVLT